MNKAKYDEDAVEQLIQTATGVSRILSIMACDAQEEGDNAQSQAFYILHDQLWRSVEDVTGENPMYLNTRFHDPATVGVEDDDGPIVLMYSEGVALSKALGITADELADAVVKANAELLAKNSKEV